MVYLVGEFSCLVGRGTVTECHPQGPGGGWRKDVPVGTLGTSCPGAGLSCIPDPLPLWYGSCRARVINRVGWWLLGTPRCTHRLPAAPVSPWGSAGGRCRMVMKTKPQITQTTQ